MPVPRLAVFGLTRLGPYLAALVAVLASVGGAGAVEVEFTAKPVRREILAVFDSRHEKEPSLTRIHKFAEMPLNFLGFTLKYVDVNAPLPEPGALGAYRGVITWLIEPLRRPPEYLKWLETATANGTRLVIMGEVAPPESEGTHAAINRVLKHLGLESTGEYVNITHKARVVTANDAMIGFERPLDKALPDFAVLSAKSPETNVHLSIETPLRGSKVTGALVATSPGGGYVSDEYAMAYDANTDRVRWIVNPFLFFKTAFGGERFPIPDVTTLAGRRIYFSHIDGDGWNNVSEIEGYRQGQVISAEVIEKEAVEPYPDLPITIGLIAGDIDGSIGGNPAAAAIARKLYALPQVEVASHTYTHPFDWQFFENYDRQAEIEKIETARRPDQSLWDSVRIAALRLAGREPNSERLNKYIAGSADLPRSYLRNPFDLDQEISGALGVSQKLAPPGKKAKIMLWSGDTVPFEAAIRASRQAGVRNMNGGDTRLDPEYPSVFYVPPIARPVGRERQIYAGDSNENTYTNFWHGPYYGFLNLETTLRNTEAPRRLKPFNVYYHMYMGEKPAALASLKHFLDLARASPVIPITASHYAGIADDFFGVEIVQSGPEQWTIGNRGLLQSVRFDDATALDIDWGQSSGVIGATRTNGALYVTLDAAVPRALVALREGAEREGSRPLVSLLSSRWELAARNEEPCGVRFTAQGFGPGEMRFAARPEQAFRAVIAREDKELWSQNVRTSPTGIVDFVAPVSAIEPVTVRLVCHE